MEPSKYTRRTLEMSGRHDRVLLAELLDFVDVQSLKLERACVEVAEFAAGSGTRTPRHGEYYANEIRRGIISGEAGWQECIERDIVNLKMQADALRALLAYSNEHTARGKRRARRRELAHAQ